MKRQIRRGVFETNSSSVHSITMCSAETYKKWEHGKLYKARYGDTFIAREELIDKLKDKLDYKTGEPRYKDVDWTDIEKVNKIIRANEYVTEDEFWDDIEFETFYETYETPNGEEIVAFGYYGHD